MTWTSPLPSAVAARMPTHTSEHMVSNTCRITASGDELLALDFSGPLVHGEVAAHADKSADDSPENSPTARGFPDNPHVEEGQDHRSGEGA